MALLMCAGVPEFQKPLGIVPCLGALGEHVACARYCMGRCVAQIAKDECALQGAATDRGATPCYGSSALASAVR